MKTFRSLMILGVMLLGINFSHAEDTDIFLTPPSAAVRPNVLIIVDNTANWSRSFTSERQALASVVSGLTDQVNVGIMMFTESGGDNGTPDGGYVRYAVKQMTAANKADLIGKIQNYNVNNDKSNGSKFSLAMLEAFQYFKGLDAYAGANKVKRDLTAFVGASSTATRYSTPLNDACQKNFIIVLSNGPAGDNNNDGTISKTKLAEYAGLATGTFPPEITLNPNQEQSVWADEWSRFMAGSDISPLAGNQNIITYTVDVVNTNNETQSWQAHSALLYSMGKVQGKGDYFKIANASENTTTTDAIRDALNNVFTQIQAVDSVFAASTLPVSVNVRGTYLNQVYMGVFRPDAESSPRWFGNLKQYKLALDNFGNLFLGDVNGTAIENPATGFVTPGVTSIWSSSGANVWSYKYPEAPTDAPDGDKVEKGGAAQKIRTAFATAVNLDTRRLFTCTGPCAAGAVLGSSDETKFSTANTSNITTALLGAANSTERDNIINWVRGADNNEDENGDENAVNIIRPSVHGDVLHSRPAVINYNRTSEPANRDIYVFYGGNDGVFHGTKGGDNVNDGSESWGFIPSEFFGKLKRLRNAATDPSGTKITTANPKGYFMDGPIGIHYFDSNADGRFNFNDNDVVQLFLTARRGGRLIYALDVSNPVAPKFLWKKTSASSGYGELAQTWSEPQVARINYGGSAKNVLIFGGGYDPTVDDLDPDRTYTTISSSTNASNVTTTVTTNTRKQVTSDDSASGTVTSTSTVTAITAVTTNGVTTTTTGTPSSTTTTYNRSMGRALYVVDIADGSVLWRVGRPGSGANLEVSGLDYSIPSDITALDLDGNGYIETLYFGDTGGNLWRANIGDQSTSNWTVTKLASVGGSAANKRKILFKPDVVLNTGYRSILFGTGDREHPLDTSVTNRFYMIKDTGTSSGLTESNLYDATENSVQSSDGTVASTAADAIASSGGWYITFASGEKVVGGVISLGGATFFSTNQPAALANGSCSNLGLAQFYSVNYLNGGVPTEPGDTRNLTASLRVTDRSTGLPPSPIGISVEIGGKTYETVCQGTHCQKPPSVTVGQRYRVYWHLDIDK